MSSNAALWHLQGKGFIQNSLQLSTPIIVLVFPFIQNINAETIVGEIFGEFLPRNFVADLFEIFGNRTFVRRVFAALQMLAFAFYRR